MGSHTFSKYNAYHGIADSSSMALDLLQERKLGFGENAIVPFYYPNKDAEDKQINIMEGIGLFDGEFITRTTVDDTVIKPKEKENITINLNGEEMSLEEAINTLNDKLNAILAAIYD